MRKIHIIGNKRVCYTKHLHPIRVFRQSLLNAGMVIKYFSDPEKRGITDCDALIFLEGLYREILPIPTMDRKVALDYLQSFFSKFHKVIWFDDRDESGNLRTYIFPIIDIYAKSQHLVNHRYYQKDHLTGIPHRDFVTKNYHIRKKPNYKGPVSDQDLLKLKTAWNLALVNWVYNIENSPIIKELFLKNRADYKIEFTPPNLSTRKIHISYRAGMRENIPTVSWWRKTTRRRLIKFQKKHPKLKMNAPNFVSKREYHKEMKDAIISPSPFGIGEICYRDFECFMNGSLLLKPNMDHLKTWPDLFINGETYIAHKWDFSDFEEKLEDILVHPDRYEDVAREGQIQFRESLTDGHGFATHFKEIIS